MSLVALGFGEVGTGASPVSFGYGDDQIPITCKIERIMPVCTEVSGRVNL